jgi:hypothetical protein
MTTYTVPGTDTTIKDISYFITDPEKTKELVNEIFYKNNTPVSKEDYTPVGNGLDIKKLKIQILNGTDKEGLAADKSETLRQFGYNVINVGNYYGEKQAKTRVMAKTAGDYAELARLFKDPAILTDNTMDDKFDIIIILGTSE